MLRCVTLCAASPWPQFLQDNIVKFERLHGEIKVPEAEPLPLNFGGPKAEA